MLCCLGAGAGFAQNAASLPPALPQAHIIQIEQEEGEEQERQPQETLLQKQPIRAREPQMSMPPAPTQSAEESSAGQKSLPLQAAGIRKLPLLQNLPKVPLLPAILSDIAAQYNRVFLKRKFIDSNILRPKITPSSRENADFPPFSATVFIPKFFDEHERLERVDLSSRSRLRFSTMVDFFPFAYLDKSGNLAGYHVDLVRALCTELAMDNMCSIEAAPWEELPKRLASGKTDAVIAGLAPTADMRSALRFSRAYMRFPARFMVRNGSGAQQDALKFLRLGYDFAEFMRVRGGGFTVGVIAGTVHEEMMQAYFGTVSATSADAAAVRNKVLMRSFANGREVMAALNAGKVDFAFGDGMQFVLWLRQCGEKGAGGAIGVINSGVSVYGSCLLQQQAAAANEPRRPCCAVIGGAYFGSAVLGQGLRIAVSVKDKPLEQAFDYALQQLERKGKLAELYLRYFPVGFY